MDNEEKIKITSKLIAWWDNHIPYMQCWYTVGEVYDTVYDADNQDYVIVSGEHTGKRFPSMLCAECDMYEVSNG